MFVLNHREARAEIRELSEIDQVITKLISDGYKPVLRSMTRAACESVGIPPNTLSVNSLISSRAVFRGHSVETTPIGDVFERDQHLYVLHPRGPRLFVAEVYRHSSESYLERFLHDIESAIKARLDGRRVRGMNFDWSTGRLQLRSRLVASRRFPELKLRTKEPEFSEKQSAQVKTLSSEEARSFLISLSQVGKARSVDAASISNESITKPLLDNGLIRKEFLIRCRQDSRTLGTIAEKNRLETESGIDLHCTTCGRKFSEELIQEIFALTEDARALIAGNHWMTIWITDMLLNAGITKDNIKWNAAVGEDEMDLIVDVLGIRVFFELKDREFGLGDAYPFSFRIERYGGDAGVIVSMDKVATEAKNFINEPTTRRSGKIEVIEGVNGIERKMSKVIEQISTTGIEKFFYELFEEFGIGIIPLVRAWMKRFSSFPIQADSSPNPRFVPDGGAESLIL